MNLCLEKYRSERWQAQVGPERRGRVGSGRHRQERHDRHHGRR